MGVRCRYTTVCIFLLIGIAILAVAAVVVPILKNALMNKELKDNLILEDGKTIYTQWLEPDIGPFYKVFTLFTIRNADDVAKGAKPNVSEVGPYYFREVRKKFDPQQVENDTVVRFKQNKYYVFDRSKTPAELDPDKDAVTTVNAIVATSIDKYLKGSIRKKDFRAVMFLVDFHVADLFVTHTVTELLWGYSDALIKAVHAAGQYPKTNFSLQVNNSAPDYLTWSAVKTGKDNMDEIGEYVMWQGQTNLDLWNSTYANMLNGTEGFFFRSGLEVGDNVTVFIDDLFRSANLTCSNASELESIKLLRCSIPEWELLNEGENPDNAEWFANFYSGLLNESSTQYGAPLFISKPHFLDADPRLRENLTGLSPPNRQVDDTWLDVEPITGALFNTHKRLQANIRLRPVSDFSKVSKVRDVLIPVFFVDETVTSNSTTCDNFKSQVYKPMNIVGGVRWGLIALGGLTALVCILIGGRMIFKSQEENRTPLLLGPSEDIN